MNVEHSMNFYIPFFYYKQGFWFAILDRNEDFIGIALPVVKV